MKQIENVSISGISFRLDSKGYGILSDYLARLGETYRDNPDGAEIIADIEARIAELILSKQAPESIVDGETIAEITGRLGLPEEDPIAADMADHARNSAAERTFPRRLFRDMRSRRLGGVFSGIATYFGIDPVRVRLGAFAPLILLIVTAPFDWDFLSSMLGVLIAAEVVVYLLLWFTVPAARTPRQRLEMRGERITASTIEHNFRQAVPADERSQRSASVWAEIMWVLGRIILVGIKTVLMIVAVALSFAALVILFVMGAVIFAPDLISIGDMSFYDFWSGVSCFSPQLIGSLGLIAALIPIVMIVVLLFGVIFERGIRGRSLAIMGAIWLLIIVFLSVVSFHNRYELFDDIDRIHHIEISNGDVDFVESDDIVMPVDTLSPVTVEVIE